MLEDRFVLTFKYRLYPSKEQQSKLWADANSLNWLYNYFLNQRIETYRETGKGINCYTQIKELTNLKKTNPFLKTVHSQVLQQVALRLDKSYKQFFRDNKSGTGLPHFRSCKDFFGICYPQSGYTITDNIFLTKRYGSIKFVKHRTLRGNIKQIFITTKNNKWYISIITDYTLPRSKSESQIGIDVGITNIVATSDGVIIRNKRHTKYFDKQINNLKSRRDKQCVKRSRRYNFLTSTIKRLYDVKSRKTNDFLHKVSHNLSSNNDTIFCEDLELKSMSESKKTGMNRELRNSQLSKFISYLEYKSNCLIKVNPCNTSKTCNNCGHIMLMPLNIRVYNCPNCNHSEDRDINSAKNILCLGQAYLNNSTVTTLQEALGFNPG